MLKPAGGLVGACCSGGVTGAGAGRETSPSAAAAALAAEQVENRGVVLAITRGEGPARGEWVVVTRERTLGKGPYAGLPATMHVTFARVLRLGSAWRVAEWAPQS